jgi:opacity protein-like surface antigen
VGTLRKPEERADIGARIGGPRVETVGFTGFYIGGFVAGNFNTLGQTETFKMTDDVTNRFSDKSNAVGGGFNAGFLFSPWNSNILVGPSASVDFLNQDTNHTFPGNFFLGQTINIIGTVNGQIGVAATPGLFVYGELGLAFANLDHKLNFSGPVTSVNQTVPGVNLGIGAAFQPHWEFAGHPVALFAQYNHVILQNATFDNPGSLGFTYRNQNDFDVFKIGLRLHISNVSSSVREFHYWGANN